MAADQLPGPDLPRVACDSLVALGNSTADGSVLFAKNSDRPASECQPLVQVARRRHDRGARLRCQYMEIPQVEETARVIGSRPFWLWGFEHGLNEHGVAIGNHTVFTKDPLGADGLTGMDLVRLGLERATSAERAAALIGELIETHGQGGSGYFDKDWPYHNSFLIADRREAYLLETSARRWAVRRVHGAASATNHLTIGTDWTSVSADAVEHARRSGWVERDGERFDFAAAYRDTSLAPPVVSSGRYRRTCEMLAKESRAGITPASLRAALRDHYDGQVHRPGRAIDDEQYFSVCMHADPVGMTTASMIARLPRDDSDLLRYWGSLGSPCVGVFLPYYIDGEIPSVLARGGELPSAESPWWRFKDLLTRVERDFVRDGPKVRGWWDEVEKQVDAKAQEVEAEALSLRSGGRPENAARLLTRFMSENVEMALAKLDEILRRLD